jgi:hypothetical protein
MKVKTKSKPMSLLNANENVLLNQQANEKHQALNSQPITGSQPIRHTQLQKLERMQLPIRAKKQNSSYKGQEKPKNPKSVQASKLKQDIYKSMIQ